MFGFAKERKITVQTHTRHTYTLEKMRVMFRALGVKNIKRPRSVIGGKYPETRFGVATLKDSPAIFKCVRKMFAEYGLKVISTGVRALPENVGACAGNGGWTRAGGENGRLCFVGIQCNDVQFGIGIHKRLQHSKPRLPSCGSGGKRRQKFGGRRCKAAHCPARRQFGTDGQFRETAPLCGPEIITRYNLYPAAETMDNVSSGHSTGEAISAIEKIAAETLPSGMGLNGPTWRSSRNARARAA